MEKEEIIDIIITALQEKGELIGYHKMQNGKAVQIKTNDNKYFNIGTVEIFKGDSYIVKKLK